MDRADPRAGQHRNRGLRDRREINDNAIAFANFVSLQHVGETADFAMQLLISESAFLARFAFPNDGSFISSRTVKMTIKTVFRKIELPADEPFRERRFPLEYFFPRLSPNQFLRLSRPKCVRSSHRFAVHFSILGERFDPRFL